MDVATTGLQTNILKGTTNFQGEKNGAQPPISLVGTEKNSEKQQVKNEQSSDDKLFSQLDDNANQILATLLSDRLKNERFALKSILQKELELSSRDRALTQNELLQKLDNFIENKKSLASDSLGVLHLATMFKELYKNDFVPIDLSI